jgi:hypothetical protein
MANATKRLEPHALCRQSRSRERYLDLPVASEHVELQAGAARLRHAIRSTYLRFARRHQRLCAAVGRLYGCLNDVDHFHDYLDRPIPQGCVAHRSSQGRRRHSGQRDRAVPAALGPGRRGRYRRLPVQRPRRPLEVGQPFATFFPDGKDEGLVCYDSRGPGGFDLADKELAVLLAEAASNDPTSGRHPRLLPFRFRHAQRR